MGKELSKGKKDIDTSGKTAMGWQTVAAVAQSIAELDIDINQVDEDGETPLFKAIREGHIDAVSSLLENGADPNFVSKQGLTPFHMATLCGNCDMILTLLGADNLNIRAKTKKKFQNTIRVKEKKVDFDIAEGSNVLDILSQREHTDLVSVMLLFDTTVEESSTESNVAEAEPAMASHVKRARATEKARDVIMEKVRSKRYQDEAVKELLTEQEKDTIKKFREPLMGMKTHPVMVHLFSFGVLCEFERQKLKSDCMDNKKKAAQYIIDEVILSGSYNHLRQFREALCLVKQSHLANLLPARTQAERENTQF